LLNDYTVKQLLSDARVHDTDQHAVADLAEQSDFANFESDK